MKYENGFIHNMVLGDPTTSVYQIFVYKDKTNDTNMIPYFVMHGLGIHI